MSTPGKSDQIETAWFAEYLVPVASGLLGSTEILSLEVKVQRHWGRAIYQRLQESASRHSPCLKLQWAVCQGRAEASASQGEYFDPPKFW